MKRIALALILFAFAGVALGQTVAVPYDGTCADDLDGDISASIAWSSDLDGLVGTGAIGDLPLTEGVHIITPICNDSSGNPSGAIDPGTLQFVPLACIFDDGLGGTTFFNPCEIQVTVVIDDSPILTIRAPVDGTVYQD